jgi:hypothetical protein
MRLRKRASSTFFFWGEFNKCDAFGINLVSMHLQITHIAVLSTVYATFVIP